jgi:hypothetical protein
MVVVTGNNNEKLSTSELLKTKQSAWKNIAAQKLVFDTQFCVLVQDNITGKVYSFTKTGNKIAEPMTKPIPAPQVK